MKICYKEIRFRKESLRLIERVNGIIEEYQSKGYSLTLRQVYYQLVARDVIPNNERSYKNLGSLISDARMSGLIDWHAIEDRTRNVRGNQHWKDPAHIIQATVHSLRYDKWADQDYHVEVWVEKDALVGVVGQACQKLDVRYFSCRGYVSQSEMWAAAQRLERAEKWQRKQTVILHLGDHDPSGIDMSRDIVDRLELFGVSPEFRRLALNMDQIEEYGPPPNPTKLTDSRATAYIDKYGYECWELDALQPEVIEKLITDNVLEFRDWERFDDVVAREEVDQDVLRAVSVNWQEIQEQYGPDGE
ncbi:hypothetical protein [Paenibacillus agilis]|uniref:DUF2399 domain-containing protein n=1 Tax=Paenibacillus agilis TaxID=3020863 RepID=A0A559IXD7_9BACL|nr:hypothetical protein [Paenibacillus agilis]TVX92273.1 hypothetical protein FPZ44_03860 [Paenibacillus agilis]